MTGTTPAGEPHVSRYADAPGKTVSVEGTTYAYRELGPAEDVPVVLFTHLAATLDNWDPRIVDALAQRRHVITFDQRGVGGSSGQFPRTLEEAADDAYRFIRALGSATVDIAAFSMGAMIAQDLVLKQPEAVRRLVLTGTGPRGGAGIQRIASVTFADMARALFARADPKEFLFFNRNERGKAAGKAFIARLQERTADRDQPISNRAFLRQLGAIKRYGRSAPADLSRIAQPTVIVNGDNDRMVPSVLSEDLHRRIAGSELVIYPDSGHGAVFQYHDQFAPRLVAFLS
jgi:pimeloyl-ACP methyl ester carboxylesterase